MQKESYLEFLKKIWQILKNGIFFIKTENICLSFDVKIIEKFCEIIKKNFCLFAKMHEFSQNLIKVDWLYGKIYKKLAVYCIFTVIDSLEKEKIAD